MLAVTISFVLYMTMLLVLVNVQGQVEAGEGDAPFGRTMQRVLALLLLIGSVGHFIGARVSEPQRALRLRLASAEAVGAASLFLMAPEGWVWMALVAAAIFGWAFSFQTAMLEFMEQPEEAESDAAEEPETAAARAAPQDEAADRDETYT